MFLDYLKLDGPITQQATNFLLNAKHNPQWIEETFMAFVGFQLERVSRGKIAEPTIRNYYKATLVNWKMITRGLPRGKQAANDRAPTMEEIHMLVQYLERRIKAIVATMVSSGIRIGAWDYLRWKHVTPINSDSTALIFDKRGHNR